MDPISSLTAGRAFLRSRLSCQLCGMPGGQKAGEDSNLRRAIGIEEGCEGSCSYQGLKIINGLRRDLDRLGKMGRKMIVLVDGSLCNRTVLVKPLEQVEVVGRCRKYALLCFIAPAGGRSKCGEERFSPEADRKGGTIPWQTTKIDFGGA